MKEQTKFTKRQEAVLSYFQDRGSAPISAIHSKIQTQFHAVSRITIQRDLKLLVDAGLLVSQGLGRGVTYQLSPSYQTIRPFDVERYFLDEVDTRIIHGGFRFDIWDILGDPFTLEEAAYLENLNVQYRKKIAALTEDIQKKELERLVIELSWKSSKIEGNTYSLLETEQLIREHKESVGHTKDEVAMILNHKRAFEYLYGNARSYTTFSVSKIEDVHELLVSDLGVAKQIRTGLVRITGTNYRPLDNHFQIREAMEKMCVLVNKHHSVFAKALLVMILIAYIQPFADGNKRTSRLCANAALLAYGACPLSYRNIDEIEYKKALIIFYEQQNLWYIKKLFMEQYEFAVRHYFG